MNSLLMLCALGSLSGVGAETAHIVGHVGDVLHVGEFNGSEFVHYRVQGKASPVAVGRFITAHPYGVIVNINNSYIIWSYNPLDWRVVIQRLAAVPADVSHTVGVGDFDQDGQLEFVVQDTGGRAFAYEVDQFTGLFSQRISLGYVVAPGFDRAVGVADVDGDGDSDVVLQSTTTKQVRFRTFTGVNRGELTDMVRDGGGQIVAVNGTVAGATTLSGVLTLIIKPLTATHIRQWQITGTTRTANQPIPGLKPSFVLEGIGN